MAHPITRTTLKKLFGIVRKWDLQNLTPAEFILSELTSSITRHDFRGQNARWQWKNGAIGSEPHKTRHMRQTPRKRSQSRSRKKVTATRCRNETRKLPRIYDHFSFVRTKPGHCNKSFQDCRKESHYARVCTTEQKNNRDHKPPKETDEKKKPSEMIKPDTKLKSRWIIAKTHSI